MGGVTTAHRRCTLRDTKLHVVTYQKTSTSQKILVFLSFLTHKTLSIKSSVRSPCRYIQLCRVYSTSGVIRFIFALHNLYENRSRNISIVLNTARPLWGRKRRRRKKGGGGTLQKPDDGLPKSRASENAETDLNNRSPEDGRQTDA